MLPCRLTWASLTLPKHGARSASPWNLATPRYAPRPLTFLVATPSRLHSTFSTTRENRAPQDRTVFTTKPNTSRPNDSITTLVHSFLFFKDFYLPLHRCEVYLALFSNVIFIISHKVLFGNSGTQRKEE